MRDWGSLFAPVTLLFLCCTAREGTVSIRPLSQLGVEMSGGARVPVWWKRVAGNRSRWQPSGTELVLQRQRQPLI